MPFSDTTANPTNTADVSKLRKPSTAVREFDCVIVGAGPAGLACLSGIQEAYSLDHMTEGQLHRAARHVPNCTSRSVAVIDPHPEWMQGWSKHFAALNIQFLRSPCMAHPDLFDKNALLAFAEIHGRQDELIESGCGDLKSLLALGESQVGFWKLPSVSLFEDFCKDLKRRLPHSYIQGEVMDINREESGPLMEVTLRDGAKIRAADVVLGMGAVGRPIIPDALADARNLVPWTALENQDSILTKPACKKVLVVGGGLTAVQAVQCVLKNNVNAQVTLCSRRPLRERHFDLSIDWFDRRTSNKCMSDFYHQSEADRLGVLKESRGGGSVPGIYMNDLRRMERRGQVVRVVGNASFQFFAGDVNKSTIAFDNGTIGVFDAIVLACGMKPDCGNHPLCKKLLKRWPLDVVGGFPCVSEDLEWSRNLYVIGSLGSLNIGPDAANLMGMRRGAEIIANALECRCWLREENVLKNPFYALDETSSDSSDEEE